jgi:pimeloyl-ACP methyl ester carboxylesterase
MEKVHSKDGTIIAFDRQGSGPAVVLVGGATVDRSAHTALAACLAEWFTVLNFDRRGRGDSGDTLPYAVEREVEDIASVLDAAGGTAFLYGASSGAALALEATRHIPGMVRKLALWEPPFLPESIEKRPPADTVKTLNELVAAGRRSEAAEFFMGEVIGMPPDFVASAKTQPWWAAQVALAHTLAYDATIMGDFYLPTSRAASVPVPTLVCAGGADFPWMRDTARALASTLPNGRYRPLDGQGHNVDPAVLAPILTEFFNEG